MIACELEHDAFELGYSKEENGVYVAMAFLDTYRRYQVATLLQTGTSVFGQQKVASSIELAVQLCHGTCQSNSDRKEVQRSAAKIA